MDVHAIELHTGFSLPGRGPTTRRKRRPNPDSPSAPAKGGGADPEARSTVSTRRLLLAYTAASILLGLGALAWTTVTIPLLPAIDVLHRRRAGAHDSGQIRNENQRRRGRNPASCSHGARLLRQEPEVSDGVVHLQIDSDW